MLAGDFAAKLRRLNRTLRIYCGDDDSKPAGIFYVSSSGEYETVCGVDKNWLPEYAIRDEKGHIIKGGWRRALRMLVENKLIDRRKAERMFGTQLFGCRAPSTDVAYQDPVQKYLEECQMRSMCREGKPIVQNDELVDIASEINRRRPLDA